MEVSIVSYHTHEGVKTCMVIPTSRKLHIVMITGHGLVEKSKPLDEERYMRPVSIALKKGIRQFGGIAKRKGSTKAARKWMAKAREYISS
jgi:hypothetical protein